MVKRVKKSKVKRAKKSYTKRAKTARSRIKVNFPFAGHRIIPDELTLTMPIVTEFHSVGAYGTGGAMASFNVCGNDILFPFANPAVGPTFIQFDAAIGGSGGSFAGVVNSGYPAITAHSPNFYNQLMDMYRNWYIPSSAIKVEVILGDVSTEADLVICPISSANDPAIYALQESRYAKVRQIAYYQGGTSKENSLSNVMSTKTLYGLSVSDEQMKLANTNVGAVATHPSTYRWNWQIGLQNKFGTAASGTTSIKVTVIYRVNLFNPKMVNT